MDRADALAELMLLTCYGTYRELREAGLTDAKLIKQLQATAKRLLLR